MSSRSTSPSYSLVSESLVNINSTFRVSVSLQRYFKDVRSRCYMLVIRNRPVRWLEKRIQKVFALPGKFFLSTNGHMLPSCEPLALLNSDDTVDVLPCVNDLVADVITNGNTTKHDTYRCNEDTSSSNLLSITKQRKRKDLCKKIKNCFGDLENVSYENDQGTSQIVNEDQIDANFHTLEPANCLAAVDSQETNENITCSISHMMTGYDDSAQSLLDMKYKALAMLDVKIGADKKLQDSVPDPPKRSRNRVRRRRKCVNENEQDVEVTISSTESHKLQIENNCVPELLQASQTQQITMQPIVSAAESWVTENESNIISSTPTPEVTRNETICPRKPRVVYSLDE